MVVVHHILSPRLLVLHHCMVVSTIKTRADTLLNVRPLSWSLSEQGSHRSYTVITYHSLKIML